MSNTTAQPQQPCKVLVVEDHTDTATLTSRLLRAGGYDVAMAAGYSAALDAARSDRFDVLVCDIGLPDGDGCDLLTAVRAMYDVRAVALTGHGYAADRARCRRAGFGRFLLKPVTLDDLKAAVDAETDDLPCDHRN